MSEELRRRSFWLALPLIGFIITEWQVWRREQMQPFYQLTKTRQEACELPPYPLDMEPLLALPFGTLDEFGVPYNAPSKKYPAVYQPTTIAQYGLANWNAFLSTGDEQYKEAFMIQAHWLIDHELPLINDAGGWPIPFPISEYHTPELWLSALTQGNVISLLVRAYSITNDDTFLQAARRAVRTFERDIQDGGVSTSIGDNGIFFEEVAVYPAPHILNGYLLALFGLYDYVSLINELQIVALIQRSLSTLHALLDRFDMGYWTYYDLFGKPATLFYHALHVTLLEALVQYSGCKHCETLAKRWAGYQCRRNFKLRYFVVSRFARYRHGLRRLFIHISVTEKNYLRTNALTNKVEAVQKISSSDV